MQKQDFFAKAVPAVIASGHPWPLYQACEAALESGWNTSLLATRDNNLFGQKQGFSTEGCQIVEIPTREFLNGQWCTVTATWPRFADWNSCFKAQVALLEHSAIYAPALSAKTGEDYVRLVSAHWATDPERADKVLATYHANWLLLQNAAIQAKAAHS